METIQKVVPSANAGMPELLLGLLPDAGNVDERVL
jgi:hypothetical protein